MHAVRLAFVRHFMLSHPTRKIEATTTVHRVLHLENDRTDHTRQAGPSARPPMIRGTRSRVAATRTMPTAYMCHTSRYAVRDAVMLLFIVLTRLLGRLHAQRSTSSS